jgi:hypothetical protein
MSLGETGLTSTQVALLQYTCKQKTDVRMRKGRMRLLHSAKMGIPCARSRFQRAARPAKMKEGTCCFGAKLLRAGLRGCIHWLGYYSDAGTPAASVVSVGRSQLPCLFQENLPTSRSSSLTGPWPPLPRLRLHNGAYALACLALTLRYCHSLSNPPEPRQHPPRDAVAATEPAAAFTVDLTVY